MEDDYDTDNDEMDEHEDNIKHPRTSASKGSVTKSSSSEEAVVL